MDRRSLDLHRRHFVLALVSPVLALCSTTCADASSAREQESAVTPDASVPCSVDGACPSGMSCVEGACVDACQAVASIEGSIGCSFWAATPDVRVDSEGACFAAYVVN